MIDQQYPQPSSTEERGQGLVEYALLLVMVALAVLVILTLLGPAVGNIFSNIVAGIGGYAPTGGFILLF